MTEADEKLSRLFAAEAPERDPAFADAVEARLRRARAARLAARAVVALAFIAMAVASWSAWRMAAPVFAKAFAPVPAFHANILGAPAPALALLMLAGLWFVFRRFIRMA